MFTDAALVFKNGELVVRDGIVVSRPSGCTQTLQPDYDPSIMPTVQHHFDRFYSLRLSNFAVNDDDFAEPSRFRFHG